MLNDFGSMQQRNTKTPVITLSSQGTNSAVQATLVCSRKCQPPGNYLDFKNKRSWLLKTKGFGLRAYNNR